MKLSETEFQVTFNESFLKLLNIGEKQIAWMVIDAAKMMDVEHWEKNTIAHLMNDELDCWQHVTKLENQMIKVECVPYPQGFLILWSPQYPQTLPKLDSPETVQLNFPKDFSRFMNLDRKELGVFQEEEIQNYKNS